MFGYIYITINNINGKVYIGKHKCSQYDPHYMGSGTIINKAFDKYGIENFTNKIIDIADTLEELNEKEKYYIEKYKNEFGNNCYNIAKGGDGGDTISDKPEAEKREFIKKMTEINQERCSKPDFKEKISKANKKRYSNIEERKKQSIIIKQSWSNEELREQQRIKIKEYYSKNKKDNSCNYKKCVFELNDLKIEFESVQKLREFLIEEYNYNPDRRTFSKLMKNGELRISFNPFHKNKFKELVGMIIYYKTE